MQPARSARSVSRRVSAAFPVVFLVVFAFSAALCAPHAASGQEFGPLPGDVGLDDAPLAPVPFDISALKAMWRKRIAAIKASGQVPIIDVESSYTPKKLDMPRFARQMDDNGVALVAFSPQIGKKEYEKHGTLWSDDVRRLVAADPWRYLPVTTAGIYPAWTEEPERFLDVTMKKAVEDGYPLLGEFEFRHYPSPREYKRGEMFRDVNIPIDSPAGKTLFAFSERTGLSFQIHYEIEDQLLPPLEKMLSAYPGAKVIWCHLAQIRFSDRARDYGPQFVRKLIENHPNIYFDLAFGTPDAKYPVSGEHQAHVWDRENGGVKKEWVDLVSAYPWHFVAAFDIGGDRMDDLPEKAANERHFMAGLPPEVREIVAYKSAWKLFFDEDI
ncbi:amidohydrolase 2 [Desulfovibrio sp. X2]|uniref:amidohydrolase family protein n=1 Tax=Desulfovibrio sp. X2 TaxID=941449 RepID=UPI0003589CCE|nr:amidohydrolase family protein [Desulfovibrio sp. X2]EPR37564.1 amidohydrolase 2 [Desulfovibrio sp. X2]